MGGGGGGGDGGASERQAQQEREKASARAAINRVFGMGASASDAPTREQFTTVGYDPFGDGNVPSTFDQAGYDKAMQAYTTTGTPDANAAARTAGYDRIKSAVLDFNKNKLDTDREPAARQLNFALLRSGNSGGSLDVDQSNLLQRKYDQGLLDATNSADAAALEAKAGDEESRLNLLSRIDAGMDQGSAIAGANQQLQNSADRAIAAAKGNSIGNVFDNAGLLYQTSQVANGQNDAASLYSRLFGAKSGIGAGSPITNYSGTTTRT